ncbi:DUF7572 family protein [Gordonia hongkongensis]|uniref:DUF7572 family protein n=1 Tax=Gordonia hongkongensis TaxID=1701090 RepID=UPI003D73C133
MTTVSLVAEALPHMPPTTNLYRTGDGGYLAVLVVDVLGMGSILTSMGVQVPVARSHITPEVSVFHSDENGVLVDADGDPLNGLTPYASTDPECDVVVRLDSAVTTHAEALAALGYTLTEQEP